MGEFLKGVQGSGLPDSFLLKSFQENNGYFYSGSTWDHLGTINTHYLSTIAPNETFYARSCTFPTAEIKKFRKIPHYFFDPEALGLLKSDELLAYLTSKALESPSYPGLVLHNLENLVTSKKIPENPATCFKVTGQLKLNPKNLIHPLTLADLLFFEMQFRDNYLSVTSDLKQNYINFVQQNQINSRPIKLMLELETYYRLCIESLPLTELGKYHLLRDILTGHHHILNTLYAVQHNEPLLNSIGISADIDSSSLSFNDDITRKRENPYLLMQSALPDVSPEDFSILDINYLQNLEYKAALERLAIEYV